jgi:hypothetical protein
VLPEEVKVLVAVVPAAIAFSNVSLLILYFTYLI